MVKDVSKTAKLVNNPAAFMFSDIRYLLNGVQVDSVRNVGITSCMKGYFSYKRNDMVKLENAGWNIEIDESIKGRKGVLTGTSNALDVNGKFGISVPLNTLLGFAEDFKKVIMNIRQELVLIRNNDDIDVIIQPDIAKDEKVKIVIDRVVWRVPHVSVGLREQLMLTKLAGKNVNIPMPFRSWEIHEYQSLPKTTKQSWSVKTAPQLETPRFIIIGFQTNRKSRVTESMAKFDNISSSNLTVFLNGERYPYDNMNVDFESNHFAILYDMYARFQQFYYYQQSEPLLSPSQYSINAPLIGIDCSHQPEALHRSGVEIKIEFSTKKEIPDNTTAYCLILHDKAFQYSPLTKIVKQLL
ncbi:uncharacterized protein [Onthophagus taurus]|uniref:uncharacterized protein n=1 Tax=Onthophagus taurus TaxID=166361 RepID=UPI0039BE7BBF